MDWFLYDIGLRHERVKRISLFSRIKEKSLRPLFHNLKQVNLFVLRFSFSNIYQVQVAEPVFQRVLEIDISDISCKTTLNRYNGFIKLIIKKT